jgi:hypothetical protein
MSSEIYTADRDSDSYFVILLGSWIYFVHNWFGFFFTYFHVLKLDFNVENAKEVTNSVYHVVRSSSFELMYNYTRFLMKLFVLTVFYKSFVHKYGRLISFSLFFNM